MVIPLRCFAINDGQFLLENSRNIKIEKVLPRNPAQELSGIDNGWMKGNSFKGRRIFKPHKQLQELPGAGCCG